MTISKAFDTQRDELSVASEKAVLVSVALPERPWLNEADPCDEIRGLVESAGAVVVRDDLTRGTAEYADFRATLTA